MRRRIATTRTSFSCEVQHGCVTVSPFFNIEDAEGVIKDVGVPDNIGVLLTQKGNTILWYGLTKIRSELEKDPRLEKYPNVDALLVDVLRGFEPRKPGAPVYSRREPPKEIWICDKCDWDDEGEGNVPEYKRGEKYRMYRIGAKDVQEEIFRTTPVAVPERVKYMVFDDMSTVEYVRERLESGSGLPALPPEYLVLR